MNDYQEFDFFSNKREDRLYISKQFMDKFKNVTKRYISKKINIDEKLEFVKLKNELTLSASSGGKHELKALILEDTRGIIELVIQKFTTETLSPHKTIVASFRGHEIDTLYQFLRAIKYLPFNKEENIKIEDDDVEQILLSKQKAIMLLDDNLEVFEELVKTRLTKSDIISLGYRKEQLEIFEKLLENPAFFNEYQQSNDCRGTESVWQTFFEKNPWIFGYGLNYIFNSPLDGKKLEQVTSGYNFSSGGKRIDGLMKTRGLIQSLCFIEIKTHKTNLLDKEYRKECYPISQELGGAVAQIQKTVQKSIENLATVIQTKDSEGNPLKEQVHLYQPKSFVIIGSLNEFRTQNGINEDKFSSFELFRRNSLNPEIITFDELFERAKFIVKNIENEYIK